MSCDFFFFFLSLYAEVLSDTDMEVSNFERLEIQLDFYTLVLEKGLCVGVLSKSYIKISFRIQRI